MIIVKFAIEQKGSIHSDLTKSYPEIVFKGQPVFYKKIGNKVFSTFKVNLKFPNRNVLTEYIKDLNRFHMVDKLHMIEKTDDSFKYYSDFLTPTNYVLSYTLWKHGIPLKSKVEISKGEEFLEVRMPEKALGTVMEDFEKVGKVRILKRLSKEPKGLLTDAELNALKIAKRFKYYHERKRISLEELAKKCGLSRTAFRTNLRRAERKLFPKAINDYIEEGVEKKKKK